MINWILLYFDLLSFGIRIKKEEDTVLYHEILNVTVNHYKSIENIFHTVAKKDTKRLHFEIL